MKIILICLNAKGYRVTHGDRIAQILFKKYIKGELEVVESLDETQRGQGGFGPPTAVFPRGRPTQGD